MITNPTLPPKKGYVEVEINGIRQYKAIPSAQTPSSPEPANVDVVYDELAEAYREGVQSAYEQ